METLIAAIERPFFVTNNNHQNKQEKKKQNKAKKLTTNASKKEEILITIDMSIYCPTYDKYGQLREDSYSSVNFKA